MPMRIAAVAVLLLSLAAAPAGEPSVVDLWPGKPPDDAGIPGAERFFQLQMNGKPYEVGGKPTKWLTNVTAPTLTIYPAPKEKNSGLSMIICPGGGYHNLGW